jgi:hypothetical protein
LDCASLSSKAVNALRMTNVASSSLSYTAAAVRRRFRSRDVRKSIRSLRIPERIGIDSALSAVERKQM